LETRFWAKVAKTEGCWEWTGYKQPAGYGTFYMDGPKIYAHRAAWEFTNGPVPDEMHLDHTCHSRSCVNPSHLRMVTRKQNMEHQITAHANSATGVRGVHWDKAKQRYVARVGHNKRSIHVGYFSNVKDAEAAVIAKRLELFTHNDKDRA